jgi:hypothetical protein
MKPVVSHPPHRIAEAPGTILVISLLLMLLASFLGATLLTLSRTEASISSSSRGSVQALHAAEYGLEFAVNNLDPAQPLAAFPPQTLAPGVQATPGLRNGSSASPVNQGPTSCPPGYSLALGCTGYSVVATGWARGWLATIASTQLEADQSIYRGCAGTEYSC